MGRIKKKGMSSVERQSGEQKSIADKFHPSRLIAQAGIRKIVDITEDCKLESDDDETDEDIELFDSHSLETLPKSSPRSDYSDSLNKAVSAVHDAGEASMKSNEDDFADLLDDILGTAEEFLRLSGSARWMNRLGMDSERLNAPFRRGTSVICSNNTSHVLSKSDDLRLLKGAYSTAELVFLSSPAYSLDHVYSRALAAICNAQQAGEKGLTINQCLAWLACTARCPIKSLIPVGKNYPEAEKYLRNRLFVSNLPLFSEACAPPSSVEDLSDSFICEPGPSTSTSMQSTSDPSSKSEVTEEDLELAWAVRQVERCLKMLAAGGLTTLRVDDRAVLLFAIGTLYMDDASTMEIRCAAHSAVRNVLSSCPDPALLLDPLSNLTPLIATKPDEAVRWMEMFKASGVASPSLLLSIAAAHFVAVCDRPECKPRSSSATMNAYIEVLAETMIDVFAVFSTSPHRRHHRALISVLNVCLTPSTLLSCKESSKRELLRSIEIVKSKLNPNLADDAIVITELRILTRRVEMRRSEVEVEGPWESEDDALLADSSEEDDEEDEETKVAMDIALAAASPPPPAAPRFPSSPLRAGALAYLLKRFDEVETSGRSGKCKRTHMKARKVTKSVKKTDAVPIPVTVKSRNTTIQSRKANTTKVRKAKKKR